MKDAHPSKRRDSFRVFGRWGGRSERGRRCRRTARFFLLPKLPSNSQQASLTSESRVHGRSAMRQDTLGHSGRGGGQQGRSWFSACANLPLCVQLMKQKPASLSRAFFPLIVSLECRDVWFQLSRPSTPHAVGAAPKPRCQLGRSHFDPCRFIFIRYTVFC